MNKKKNENIEIEFERCSLNARRLFASSSSSFEFVVLKILNKQESGLFMNSLEKCLPIEKANTKKRQQIQFVYLYLINL